MTTKLTDSLLKALDEQAGGPVRVEHPVTQKTYVIVDSETHDRAMEALRQQEDIKAIQRGIEAFEAGRVISLDEADKRIRAELGFGPRKA